MRGRATDKTRGIWVDDQGREREQITSGRDDLGRRAVEELKRLGIGPPRGSLTTADHVEVKLAVLLRGTGQRAVTLFVNNRPCNEGRWSCDRLLPRILRPGQSLVVQWPGGITTYRGRTP